MLLNYIKVEKKDNILIEKYVELLNSGIDSSSILVLVQNSTQRKKFSEEVFQNIKIPAFEKLNIHSFHSIVYNTLNDNWCFIENSIPSNKTFILPNLVGLEISQFLLKDILKKIDVKGYNSKKSLLHQIFRRYSLIVQNNLSNEDIRIRSKILGEAFGDDAEIIMKELLASTLKYRSLDYLRQALVFNFIYKNTDYFKNIKYLLINDADEITPICFDFIKYLRPQLIDWTICFDSLGSSRCGYLSADTSIEYKLTKLFNESPIIEESKELNHTKFFNAETIFANVVESKNDKLKNFHLISLSKRAEIIDSAISKIKELFKKNIKANEITIITPLQDSMLRFTLKEKLKNCNLLFLSGNEKLIDNPLVKASINILKLMLDIEITEFELRVILSDYIGIPLQYCQSILSKYAETKKLPQIELESYNEKYQKFYKDFEEVKSQESKLSTKIYEIFTRTVKLVSENKINKFNFFIKQLRDFEKVLGDKVVIERADEIITQIENSIIAENPHSTLTIKSDDLVIATPQKIIDNKIISKYQIWLDVSHSDWVKTDTGPLYNAWVFQADWNKDEYTIEDDIFLSSQKIARILRKLTLLADNYIWAFSSLFDPAGAENFGGIEKYLSFANDTTEAKAVFKITPRKDQMPVLEYTKGRMAISAVPGAGKTTILLALIIKLMNDGVKPENIFVLTYMDSAARNFRERIKNMSPNSTYLPNISTIHGLALRILKDNSNYERLGLDADFEICDDTQRARIIKIIQGKNTKKDADDFDRAISVMKLREGDISSKIVSGKIEKFKTFYQEYQRKLAEENLIDYDDILLLSVKLLEKNPDILKYYQDICEYIIEDEAQDSSEIQQRLIGYLSGKYNNLIRCGDINQAITTTFSNADVDGFRKFIKNSDINVEMNYSQRCTQDVMTLANKLVLWGEKYMPKAFYNIMMNGVEGKNPVSKNAVKFEIFDHYKEEGNYILKEIKQILTENNDATIGILLRVNSQVAKWTEFINNAGFKSITRSESLGQKAVFNTIFSILKFIETPFDNEICAETYETLADSGFYKQRLQVDIRQSEIPFITKNIDSLNSEDLSKFLWDMHYWLSFSGLALEELVIKIGLYYYTSDIEKSNVYLIATLVKQLNKNNNIKLLIERLTALAKRPSLSGFKFFSEEEDVNATKGKVQIMTMHKSKGDEFDYVFIPELSEKSLSIDIESIDLKSSSGFMEEVKSFNPSYKIKNDKELKEFTIEENLRLLYVALTRAKKKLYLSASKKIKNFYGKEVEEMPSIIFEEL